MYFVGVTTSQSAIRRIFPEWCRVAGCPGVELIGIDLPVGAPPGAYRDALERMLADPDSRGALVTTHKVAVVDYAGDLIASLDHAGRRLGEVNCIVQRDGVLSGCALDFETSGEALDAIVDPKGRDVLIFGAGGAGTALALNLKERGNAGEVIATDVNPARLEQITRLTGARTILAGAPSDNDAALGKMRSGSIIVNATGMGKDLPGSPITAAAKFPEGAVAWDFNYRGDLKFLEYADKGGATTADGWDYFIRGWTGVMARVLDFALTAERMKAFRDIAAAERPLK